MQKRINNQQSSASFRNLIKDLKYITNDIDYMELLE